jgi:hypothetical protein
MRRIFAHFTLNFDTMARMALTTTRITSLILDQLAHGEMRLLVLTVAVRRGLDRSECIKGDLSKAIKSSLRKLVATKVVIDMEGTYALASSKRHAVGSGAAEHLV